MSLNVEIEEIPKASDGIYFHAPSGKYWRKVPSAGWAPFNQDNIKMFLRGRGLSDKTVDKSSVSPLEMELLHLQEHKAVLYAGPLAGYKAGLHMANGLQILVTTSPTIIEPNDGDFPIIQKWLQNMVGGTPGQFEFLCGWMKYGYEALRASSHRPGQVVALAGEPNSGKSAMQKLILTPIFGGRAANPFRYMMGKTEFNLDLAAAEHLMIEDAASSTKTESRRIFGAMSKQFTVNEAHSIHGKGQDAIMLNPLWHVSVSLNREPENICVLPPLDESLADKMALLLIDKLPMPMPISTEAEREAFRAVIRAELPAFAAWLLNWQPPEEIRDDRFGVVAFHHPEILDALDAQSPEIKLLALIDVHDRILKEDGKWKLEAECTAEQIEQELVTGESKFAAMRLLQWSGACGSLLGKLAAKPAYAHRVKAKGHNSSRSWILYPPPPEDAAEEARRNRIRRSGK